jgi:hypothetical protein
LNEEWFAEQLARHGWDKADIVVFQWAQSVEAK